MRALTYEEAIEVYEILEKCAGAPLSGEGFTRHQFIGYAQNNPDAFPLEYRFQGWLGFGGKWHYNGRTMRVSCYPEDETAGRLHVIAQTNKALDEWWQERR